MDIAMAKGGKSGGGVKGKARAKQRTNHTTALLITISTNLKRLRTRQGHSLERLAKLAGVSRAMLSQIETGKSVPTISLLLKSSLDAVRSLTSRQWLCCPGERLSFRSPEIKRTPKDAYPPAQIAHLGWSRRCDLQAASGWSVVIVSSFKKFLRYSPANVKLLNLALCGVRSCRQTGQKREELR